MPSVPTKPEIEAMDTPTITAAHRFGRQHEKKVRRVIQERRKVNTPPGFVPKPPTTP